MKLKIICAATAAAMCACFIPALSGCGDSSPYYRVESGSVYYTLYDGDDNPVDEDDYGQTPVTEQLGYYFVATGYSGSPEEITVSARISGLPVKGIAAQAFENCRSVRSLVIEEGVERAEIAAFIYCSQLESVVIPSTMDVGESMFGMCVSLKTVTIAEGVTSIGNRAFQQCYNLRNVNADDESTFNLPSTVTTIGGNAFYNCYGLDGALTIPDSVTEIGAYAFSHAYDEGYEMYYRGNTEEGTVTSISIGSGIKRIGNAAFGGYSSVTSLTLSEGLEYIGQGAFYGLSSLKNVTIPSTVSIICSQAFEDCGFESVTFSAQRGAYLYSSLLGDDETPGSDEVEDKLYNYNYFDSYAQRGYLPSSALSDGAEAASLLTGDCSGAYWYLVEVTA